MLGLGYKCTGCGRVGESVDIYDRHRSVCMDRDQIKAKLDALLAHPMPIGIHEPPIVSFGDGTCGVLVDDRGDALTVEEARGYAAAILRAADEAEERNR